MSDCIHSVSEPLYPFSTAISYADLPLIEVSQHEVSNKLIIINIITIAESAITVRFLSMIFPYMCDFLLV